ncbi:hypothetical protein EV207_10246 [Scopulibacillus darangshiensis]|uniref:Spore germination protein GerPA/GerPF n=1 Tax=Scopulibacillus darangshiensis TaxID=442528 RepID=A0A4R2P9G9_9BACL|nr:hypothetical protein [Scopulibacillus darangshiensis]TCP31557.1 hypothetical protein EV207_10246 [Scopulibacillus darangshiensis]
MPSVININAINVSQLSTNSIIGNGENLQFGWSSHQKRMYSVYNVGQFSLVPYNLNLIYDTDLVDVPINDQDLMGGGAV